MYSQRNQNMLENLKSISYKINTRKHNFIKQILHNDRILIGQNYFIKLIFRKFNF